MVAYESYYELFLIYTAGNLVYEGVHSFWAMAEWVLDADAEIESCFRAH